MPLTGKQKAVMLLMSLDATNAAELLKGVNPEVIKELSAELVHLENARFKDNKQSLKLVRQFCSSLQTRQGFRLKGFLKEMLRSAVGAKRAEQIQIRIQELLPRNDPFAFINSVGSQKIASTLEHEHPQTAAVVLSGLSMEKNLEVLRFMDGPVSLSVVGRMHRCKAMTSETKRQMAENIYKQLEAHASDAQDRALPSWPEQSLRKVAVILRNLGKEIRDGLVKAVQKEDSRVGETITDLMIVWEDIPELSDDSLRDALGGIEVRKLALALVSADKRIVRKIKTCLPESTSVAIESEIQSSSVSKEKDVDEMREHIVRSLREMNMRGELSFVEAEVSDI